MRLFVNRTPFCLFKRCVVVDIFDAFGHFVDKELIFFGGFSGWGGISARV